MGHYYSEMHDFAGDEIRKMKRNREEIKLLKRLIKKIDKGDAAVRFWDLDNKKIIKKFKKLIKLMEVEILILEDFERKSQYKDRLND